MDNDMGEGLAVRLRTLLLAFIVMMASIATIAQSSTDDDVILAGNQAEVPTWQIGDWWDYELGGGVDAMGLTVSVTGNIRFEVTEIMTKNVGGPVYRLYNLSISGSFTGSGSGTVEGVDVDVVITSASLAGFWWVERGDLAVIVDNETVSASGTVTMFLGTFPFILDAEIQNVYSPSREDYDFPMEVGDQWDLNVTMATTGYVYYFIDIPLFPMEDMIPLNNVTNFAGTSFCNQQSTIMVPAGSFDSFEASLGATDQRWYSETVGYMVKWENHGGFGMFGDLWVNLTAYGRVVPAMTVTENLLPEKVAPGGNVTVMGTSTAPQFSTVNVKGPVTGSVWMGFTDAAGSYSVNITAPTIPDNTPTPTDVGSHGIVVEIIGGGTKGYAVRSLTLIPPDLYVLNISLSPTPTDGNPTDISADVHCGPLVNVTNNILVAFYVDGKPLGSKKIPQMTAGSVVVVSEVWTATSGLHDVTVTVDPFDSVAESNETNNSVTLQVAVMGPDLAPTNITVENGVNHVFPTGEPDHISNVINVPTGSFVNISASVTNFGLSYVLNMTTLMIIETFGPGGSVMGPPLLMTEPLYWLNQSESHGPFRVIWVAPPIEGMHYFNVSVDPYHNVTDMNLGNNTFVLQFNAVQAFPDLYITPGDISFSSQPYLGNPTTVYADVHANANMSVTSSFVVSFLSDGQMIGNDTLSSVPAGGFANASTVWVPDVGTHTIWVSVDPLDSVGESDESNNSAVVIVSVPWPDLSPRDITVKDGSVYFYQDPELTSYMSEVITTYIGQSHTISLNVTNFGSSFYNIDFRASFYETDGLGGPQNQTAFYDNGSLGPLIAGQSHGPLVATWFVPAYAGSLFVNLTVDADDTVPETSEPNNTFILRFEVLVPDDVDYIPTTSISSPIQTSIGKQVNLTTRVENVGTISTSIISKIVFYLQSDPSTLLLEDTVIGLNGGGTSPSTYGFDWTPPGVGTYEMVIEVDYYNDIPETDETNNEISITIEVYDLPETTISVGTPNYLSDPVYVTSTTSFDLSATDHSGQGIDRIMYRVAGGTWVDYLVTGDFAIGVEGPAVIEFYSVDMIGGVGPVKDLSVFVDNTPPVTVLEYAGTVIRPSTDLELSASDSGSGVASRWYRYDGGTWIRYSIPFALEEGSYTLEFYSIDNLDNIEKPTEIQLQVGLQDIAHEANFKPILSVILAVILLILGLFLCRRKTDQDEEPGGKGFFTDFDKRAFLMLSVSFAIIELLIGGYSAATGSLSIPPTLGSGLIVDLAIFIIGVIIAFLWNRKEKSKPSIVD